METLQTLIRNRVREIIEQEAPKVDDEQWHVVQHGITVDEDGQFALIIGRQSNHNWRYSQDLYTVVL